MSARMINATGTSWKRIVILSMVLAVLVVGTLVPPGGARAGPVSDEEADGCNTGSTDACSETFNFYCNTDPGWPRCYVSWDGWGRASGTFGFGRSEAWTDHTGSQSGRTCPFTLGSCTIPPHRYEDSFDADWCEYYSGIAYFRVTSDELISLGDISATGQSAYAGYAPC